MRKPPRGVAGFADDKAGDVCDCCCRLSCAGNTEAVDAGAATGAATTGGSGSTLLEDNTGDSSAFTGVGCDGTGGEVIHPSAVTGMLDGCCICCWGSSSQTGACAVVGSSHPEDSGCAWGGSSGSVIGAGDGSGATTGVGAGAGTGTGAGFGFS